MAKTKPAISAIGVLTNGGDCPGLNAVIRAVSKTAIMQYGLTVFGIEDGYLGLIQNRMRLLDTADVSNILTQGGTIIGTSNTANPFGFQLTVNGKDSIVDVSDMAIRNLKKRGIDALVCIGGDGSQSIASKLAKKGLRIIGVPKTIDNDLFGTDRTFGFDTAVFIATEAIDRVHTTASSHHRVMIVEVMGRNAGWIALHAGTASGADVILIPEIPYDLKTVCKYILRRSRYGKRFSIVVVSEGARPRGGKQISHYDKNDPNFPMRLGGIGQQLAADISQKTQLECRAIILGHVQRGGTPTPFDRALATRFGYEAVRLLMNGCTGCMVALRGDKISSVSLESVAGKQKTIRSSNHLMAAAKAVGTSFGV
ncbi:MAG: ATP-dependent 6-phosphofructokinase [Actinobacteria bacterium]|nr:ATP-dependent 6-phosphofructokinase [Actinomycetota bacterium]